MIKDLSLAFQILEAFSYVESNLIGKNMLGIKSRINLKVRPSVTAFFSFKFLKVCDLWDFSKILNFYQWGQEPKRWLEIFWKEDCKGVEDLTTMQPAFTYVEWHQICETWKFKNFWELLEDPSGKENWGWNFKEAYLEKYVSANYASWTNVIVRSSFLKYHAS